MKLTALHRLARDSSGNAAAEMALAAPLLLIIMLGCTELGNYYWNEHTLLKAVRDGARYAARQPFTPNYSACSGDVPTAGTAGTVNDNTKNVVMYGSLTAGTNTLVPNIAKSGITVTRGCDTTTTWKGLYEGDANGAHTVTVTATVTYRPVIAMALGFSGVGYQLYAQSQAAVTGL